MTRSEEILNKLGKRAFLSAWSYASPFRDQKQNGKGSGKELCDFLVVFGDHVLIFSDKHIVFPSTGDLNLDWSRWYRRAVSDSWKQVAGAERWLRKFSGRVYADSQCTTTLEIEWPTNPIFHRIVVVRGAADRANLHTGSPGLAVTNRPASTVNAPFLLAQPSNDEFCHVIDEVALDRILRFLDTAPDFIRYIDQKQRFLSEVAIVDASSEQDILAWYLTTYNDEEEHAFPTFSSSSAVTVPKHLWNSFENSAQYGAWMEANRISYGYDDIIERFFRHHTQGTQYFREHQLGTAQMKLLLRFFASMDRFQRRIISEKISSWVHVIRGKTDFRFTTVIIPTRPQSPFMGILVMSKLSYAPEYADFRKARRTLLEGLAHAIKHVYPRAEDILCLAIDSSPDGQSEDALYLDAREWSPEQAEIGRSMHEDAGLLANTRVDKKDRWEFPVYEEQTLGNSVRKQGRNDRCQCGSGKKFKNCCLKNLYD